MPRSPRHTRSERGQTSAEYLGILAFVAAIAALVTGFGPSIGSAVVDGIQDALCKVVGGDCGSFPDAELAEGESSDGEQVPLPADPALVDDALGNLRDGLDGGFFGTRSGNLSAIEEILSGCRAPSSTRYWRNSATTSSINCSTSSTKVSSARVGTRSGAGRSST